MKAIPEERDEEDGWGEVDLLPDDQSPCLLTQSFEFLIDASLYRHDWFNYWPLTINSTISPLSLSED